MSTDDGLNYLLTSGYYAGRVVAPRSTILDVSWTLLPTHLRILIRKFAVENCLAGVSIEDAKDAYENSWETEPTTEKVNLLPLSVTFNLVRLRMEKARQSIELKKLL
jgi:hypothetical protein